MRVWIGFSRSHLVGPQKNAISDNFKFKISLKFTARNSGAVVAELSEMWFPAIRPRLFTSRLVQKYLLIGSLSWVLWAIRHVCLELKMPKYTTYDNKK